MEEEKNEIVTKEQSQFYILGNNNNNEIIVKPRGTFSEKPKELSEDLSEVLKVILFSRSCLKYFLVGNQLC